ncbi:MAG: SDR family oxidoreductase [Acidimicrobiales bacterium]|nr:SDR family oxidoreductase [Acidimicrobiales bacterium]
MSSELAGRVALVTGANQGIGAAAARALAELGADVAISYHQTSEDGDEYPPEFAQQRGRNGAEVVAAIEGLGRRAVRIAADFMEPSAPARLFGDAERALGPVDILVNNASGVRRDTFRAGVTDAVGRTAELVNGESYDAQFMVNARAGGILIARYAASLAERNATWGRIISLTSGGPMGFPGEASYGAAKAALDNFTMTASIELAGFGVTANVVHPPVTDTGWVTDEVRAFVAQSTDHVHVATPDDVAEVIAWLCTDAARMVTGNVIRLR